MIKFFIFILFGFVATVFCYGQLALNHILIGYAYSDEQLGSVAEYERYAGKEILGKTKVRLLKLKFEREEHSEVYTNFYQIEVDSLMEGDLVQLEAQVEGTNDLHLELKDVNRETVFNGCQKANVMLAIRLRARNPSGIKKWIGPWATMNITPNMHHGPLRVSKTFIVPAEGGGKYTFYVSGYANSTEIDCKWVAHLSIEGKGPPANETGSPYGSISALIYREID